MQAGWRVGSLFGIPLYIDSSWLVILAIATLMNGRSYLQEQEWSPALGWSAGFVMALLLFASVLLHELGHSLVARSQGITVNSITLFLFGGIASIDRESKTPGQAFQVAIAGPAVSFILFVLLGLLAAALPETTPANVIATDISTINLVLAIFNMIPGLPLDGGQILKSAVWKITGNRFKAVHWAAQAGKILGLMAIAFGMAALLLGGKDGVGGLWIAFLGWFALRNANAYDKLTDVQEGLVQIRASEVMTRDFRVIDADMSVRQFADEYLLLAPSRSTVYFAASDGRYRGLVSPDDIRFVERSLWETRNLHSIVHSLAEILTVEETTPLVEVINRMEAHQMPWITVLSPAGAVAGIIDRGDIVRVVAEKLNLPIPRAEIERIKEEGNYPPGLQLGTIAKSTTL